MSFILKPNGVHARWQVTNSKRDHITSGETANFF